MLPAGPASACGRFTSNLCREALLQLRRFAVRSGDHANETIGMKFTVAQ